MASCTSLVNDSSELAMLAVKAQAFLQAYSDANTISPGDPGSSWAGYVGGKETYEVNQVCKAMRYGINVYVMVVRCTHTHDPRPGYEGRDVEQFDQGLVFAGDVNLQNIALGQ
jgi:hypothetical protein